MQNQCQIAVHLGAHRTGTTLLQKYLYNSKEVLELHNCRFLSTNETRSDLMRHLFDDPALILKLPDAGQSLQTKIATVLQNAKESGQKLLLSEENAIGTMEVNFHKRDLYPDLRDKLLVLKPSFEHVDTIYISIRRLDLWWASCFAFLVARNMQPPNSQLFNAVAKSTRNWSDLIKEIKELHPKIKVVVRDCDYLIDNPKRQLIKGLGWHFLEVTKRLKLKANSSKSADKLRKIVTKRGDHEGAKRIAGSDRYMPFTHEQIESFTQRYETDLDWMRANLTGNDVFLEAS